MAIKRKFTAHYYGTLGLDVWYHIGNYTFMSDSLPPDFVYKKRKFHHIVTEFEGRNYHVLKKNYVLSQKINVEIVLT